MAGPLARWPGPAQYGLLPLPRTESRRVRRLVEADLAAAGQPEGGLESPRRVGALRALHVLRGQRLDGRPAARSLRRRRRRRPGRPRAAPAAEPKAAIDGRKAAALPRSRRAQGGSGTLSRLASGGGGGRKGRGGGGAHASAPSR